MLASVKLIYSYQEKIAIIYLLGFTLILLLPNFWGNFEFNHGTLCFMVRGFQKHCYFFPPFVGKIEILTFFQTIIF